jgi:3-oxoacyl-[acyl-carrier protein] reductase
MNLSLKGKRALVCGSTQGIGKAAALELALLGAEIILVARNEEALKATTQELDASFGQKHRYLVADFDFPDQLKSTVENHVKSHGPVHVLVNNTGGPPGGPITSATSGQFEKTFSNHLLCNHLLMQVVLEGMKKEQYGRIINIISTSVKIPLKGLGVSNTIRAAVANWSKTLAGEVAAFGITVNNVLPGATNTQRLQGILDAKSKKNAETISEVTNAMIAEIPMRRFAEASEIANAVAFLASPAAGYITGINIPVDGGRTGSL